MISTRHSASKNLVVNLYARKCNADVTLSNYENNYLNVENTEAY